VRDSDEIRSKEAIPVSHGHAALGTTTPQSTFYDTGRFGRLFPTLPPFASDTPFIREALTELGSVKGLMDAQDDLSDPVTLITDPAKSQHNPNNPAMTAGMTFLGQFIDHDMTFDPTSSLARQQDPESIRNFRIPALDLDSVYGGGPACAPHLYDHTVDQGRTAMLTEEIPGSGSVSIGGTARFDLPRNGQNVALTGDPRNDENLIVSQLHLAMLRFHNRVLDDVRADLGPGHTFGELFAEAQRIVRWHYQWIVIHEFLTKTVGQATVDDILHNGLAYYSWRNDPFIPVEFSVGAYRFGHSQVRPSYRANFGTSATDATRQFFGLIFDPTLTDDNDPGDLRGGKRAARRFIDWQTFFDFGDGRAKPNKAIDTTLSSTLFQLMGQPQGEPVSLAARNLLRNLTMKVPSGQSVAKAMRLPVLAPADLADLDPFHLKHRTPLWFYVLREAQVTAGGQHLGPVGGRIVAEVIIGLIQGDRTSYLRQDQDWIPTYGQNGSFTMADLLRTAGVVATLT
jgi:Animal haem peroxidase